MNALSTRPLSQIHVTNILARTSVRSLLHSILPTAPHPSFNGGNPLSVIGPFAQVNGDASINLLPGTITNLGLGKKELKGRTGEIVIHDAHVKVDACGGQVSVRFFASVMIDTDKSDDSVNAYGDIRTL